MATPREAALAAGEHLPAGDAERFAGYGVMGLPFASGHVLAMRRFPTSSVGDGYTSVWHRDPSGHWMFWQDVDARSSCPRYFGKEIHEAIRAAIDIEWIAADGLRIVVHDRPSLEWELRLRSTPMTGVMNAISRLVPEGWWRNRAVLALMGRLAGPALRAGRLRMSGMVPNGQQFAVNPRLIWAVAATRARLGEDDLGEPGRLARQARLGDFFVPQRGLFAVGNASFEAFDARRHSPATSAP